MAEPFEYERTSWGRRLRSVLLLSALVGLLGMVTAAAVGVAVVALSSLVDQALG